MRLFLSTVAVSLFLAGQASAQAIHLATYFNSASGASRTLTGVDTTQGGESDRLLWVAVGYRQDGGQTISSMTGCGGTALDGQTTTTVAQGIAIRTGYQVAPSGTCTVSVNFSSGPPMSWIVAKVLHGAHQTVPIATAATYASGTTTGSSITITRPTGALIVDLVYIRAQTGASLAALFGQTDDLSDQETGFGSAAGSSHKGLTTDVGWTWGTAGSGYHHVAIAIAPVTAVDPEDPGGGEDPVAIPTERLAVANWQTAGVTANSGIPARSTICATILAATYGNGTDDATVGIQAALDACPTGQTVLLGPGTFQNLSTIIFGTSNAGKTIRGSGAGVTLLNKTNGAYRPEGSWPVTQHDAEDDASIFRVGQSAFPNFENSTTRNLVADAVKGEYTLELPNVTGLTVGQFVEVSEDQFYSGSECGWKTLALDDGDPNTWDVWGCDKLSYAKYRRAVDPIVTITSSDAGTDLFTTAAPHGLLANSTNIIYISGHTGAVISNAASNGVYLVTSAPTTTTFGVIRYSDNAVIDITTGGTGGTLEVGRAFTSFSVGPTHPTDGPVAWFNRGHGHLYGEIKKIASIDGNVVTFTTPFIDTYRVNHDAELAVTTTTGGFVTGVGIEDMSLRGGSRGAIEWIEAAESWAKNVEVTEWGGHGLQIVASFQIEATGTFIHTGAWPVPGGGGYAIALEDNSTEILITNSITRSTNKNIVANSGGAGSVVSYNYFDDSYIWYDLTWVEVSANASHFAGPHHVLFEGNRAVNFDSDFTHGSAYEHTVLRNHLVGVRANGPNTPTFTGTVNSRTIGLGMQQQNMTTIGNVLGTAGNMGEWVLTDPGSFWTSKFIYKIGYSAGNPDQAGDPDTVASYRTIGDYNYLAQGIRVPSADVIPDSYYLAARPAFFGTCAWPWVDPDAATKTQTLPAYARFVAGQPNDTATNRCASANSGPRRLRLRIGE